MEQNAQAPQPPGHTVMNSIQGEILTSEVCVSVKRSGDLRV
jgi:hypothetical protein